MEILACSWWEWWTRTRRRTAERNQFWSWAMIASFFLNSPPRGKINSTNYYAGKGDCSERTAVDRMKGEKFKRRNSIGRNFGYCSPLAVVRALFFHDTRSLFVSSLISASICICIVLYHDDGSKKLNACILSLSHMVYYNLNTMFIRWEHT